MKNLKFVLAALVISVASLAQAQDATAVNAKFAEAAEALKAKNFAAAIPLLEQVIDEGMVTEGAEATAESAKKTLPQALFANGGASFQAGKLDEALALFTSAAEKAELYGNVGVLNNARTWIGRTVLKQGADAFNTKDFATAASIFKKGYDGNPNDTAVAMNLAMSYAGMGDYAKANDVYRAVFALGAADPRFAEAAAKAEAQFATDNMVRANEAAKSSDWTAVIAAGEEILASAKDPEAISNASYLIGGAYQSLQNTPRAIEFYKRVTVGSRVDAAKTQITELSKAQ